MESGSHSHLFNSRYVKNLNLCLDNNGDLASCPKNCIGVDVNAVVIAGPALIASTALGAVGATSIQTIEVGLFGVANLGSVFFSVSFFLLPALLSPRRGYCRVLKFCMGF